MNFFLLFVLLITFNINLWAKLPFFNFFESFLNKGHQNMIEKKERDFSLRFGGAEFNIYGDFNATGASILCVTDNDGQCNWNYDGYLYDARVKYLQEDSNIPLNSSSATLHLPPDVNGSNIVWAGLYWQGHIWLSDNEAGKPTREDFQNALKDFDKVIFKTPDGSLHSLTADQKDYIIFLDNDNNTQQRNGGRLFYSAFKNVTNLVKNSYTPSSNIFTVGDLKTNDGADSPIHDLVIDEGKNTKYGPWGGWVLLVVYQNPDPNQIYKNISIYDGFRFLVAPFSDDNKRNKKCITINIDGFLTPKTPPVNSNLLFFSAGSEKKMAYDVLKLRNKQGAFKNVHNSLNPTKNQFNDSLTYLGHYFNSSKIYNPGLDMDIFDVGKNGFSNDIIQTDQSSTTFKLCTESDRYQGEQALPSLMAFSTQIFIPNINPFSLKIYDENMTHLLDKDHIVQRGDTLSFLLDFNNTGQEIASDVTIFDDLTETRLSDLVENNVTKILQSIRLSDVDSTSLIHCPSSIPSNQRPIEGCRYYDANCSVESSGSGEDLIITKVWCHINQIAPSERYQMKFQLTIDPDLPPNISTDVNATAHSTYKNATTGKDVILTDDGYGGSSNVATAGMIKAIQIIPSILDFGDADIQISDYRPEKNLHTKVAGSRAAFKVFYMGHSGASTPQRYNGSIPMLILFNITEYNTSVPTDFEVNDSTPTIMLQPNMKSALSLPLSLPNKAIKKAKILAKAIDFYHMYQSNPNICLLRSSNISGMPACVRSKRKYKSAFGTAATQRCWVGNGGPCRPRHHGYGRGQYNTKYGCYICTMDAIPAMASTDNFAIRPAAFKVFGNAQYRKAAEPFTLTIKAIDDTSAHLNGVRRIEDFQGVKDYNVSLDELNITLSPYHPAPNIIRQMQEDIAEANTTINGQVDYCPHIGHITWLSGSRFWDGVATPQLKYSETGVRTLHISEKNLTEFALIDADDTPDIQRFITPTNVVLDPENTSYSNQMVFIPYKMQTIATYHTTTSNDWVYISNYDTSSTPSMAGYISYTIKAYNKDDELTQNFTKTCFPDTGIDYVNGLKYNSTFDQFLDIWLDVDHNVSLSFYTEDNQSSPVWTLNPQVTLSVGSHHVRQWISPFQFEHGIGKVKVFFNINRPQEPLPPVSIKILDANTSTSWMMNAGATNQFVGSHIDQTKYYYYARLHAPIFKTKENNITTKLFFEVYDPDKADPAGIEGAMSEDDIDWYRNTAHDSTAYGQLFQLLHNGHDLLTSGDSDLEATLGPLNSGVRLLTLKYKKNKYPYNAKIDLNASGWLIYNRYNPNATTNTLEVIFEGKGNWKGIGTFKSQDEINQSKVPYNRIQW